MLDKWRSYHFLAFSTLIKHNHKVHLLRTSIIQAVRQQYICSIVAGSKIDAFNCCVWIFRKELKGAWHHICLSMDMDCVFTVQFHSKLKGKVQNSPISFWTSTYACEHRALSVLAPKNTFLSFWYLFSLFFFTKWSHLLINS